MEEQEKERREKKRNNPDKTRLASLLISILFHTGQPIGPNPRPCRRLLSRVALEWALKLRVSHPAVHLERLCQRNLRIFSH